METILCAAIHYTDGKVHPSQPLNIETGFVVCGRRHHNCYTLLDILGVDYQNEVVCGRDHQGFITSKNRYVGRREGFQIALAAKQIPESRISNDDEMNILTSEDLYWGGDE